MKNYPYYRTDQYDHFRAFVDGIAVKYRSAPAISTYSPAGEIATRTYEEMASDIHALAEYLYERGLAGEHMAIISHNSYMSVVAFLAIVIAGGVAVPLDTDQMPGVIGDMLAFADTRLVLISEDMLERYEDTDVIDEARTLILSGDAALEDGLHRALARGRELIAERGRLCPEIPIDPNQTAAIVYTSGTTSSSKAVMLSHTAMLLNASGSTELIKFPPRIFTSLPLYHAYGLTCALINNLINGAEICINGDIRYMMRDFSLFKPTGLMAVPLIADMLCKILVNHMDPQECAGNDFISLVKRTFSGAEGANSKCVAAKEKIMPGFELLLCGGAHLSPRVAKTLNTFGVTVIEGYGITECAPLISANRNEYYKWGTAGVALPSYELKFEDGEILVRGKCLMNGYYKQEDLTREVMADGWFRTGDLGYRDSRGFLTITGRKKNTIVLKNGKKVAPEELEACLAAIPLVKESMVYGSALGNDMDDVVPAVTIYPDPTEAKGMNSYEILRKLQSEVNAINENLPAFKQIRIVNIREEEFEKTSTKKIKRTVH